MEPPIPLKGVVLFIAFGSMVFIIVFCFIKRQITRFTLRSSHGPHVPIGMGAPKALRTEIERNLRRAKEISYEPVLLPPSVEDKYEDSAAGDPSHYMFRMKTVDALAELVAELKRCGMSAPRKPGTPLKVYLLDARQSGRPLEGARLDLVEKVANTYERARHDPAEFTVAHYQEFMSLLNQLLSHIRIRCGSGIATVAHVSSEDVEVPTTRGFGFKGFKKLSSSSHSAGLRPQFTSPSSAASGSAAAAASTESTQQQQRFANYAIAGLFSSGKSSDAGERAKKL